MNPPFYSYDQIKKEIEADLASPNITLGFKRIMLNWQPGYTESIHEITKFLYEAEDEDDIKIIGHRLNKIGGMDAMQAVYYILYHYSPLRELRREYNNLFNKKRKQLAFDDVRNTTEDELYLHGLDDRAFATVAINRLWNGIGRWVW